MFRFCRGNVSFVYLVTFRARLFLFPVDCSLFPLYYPLHFRQHLDKSEFVSLPEIATILAGFIDPVIYLCYNVSMLNNGSIQVNRVQPRCHITGRKKL